ncbi:CLUMA_CG020500, isoform A [Clunio marinus]|uniref:CLUMA_CG020500, isoform A n=1 Tax=Clunio marinus TaxID=568069 RepID=A0A1J1J569_9DIPT|nr:CLUMA_CG020500, isoform A [Clunio marinus]
MGSTNFITTESSFLDEEIISEFSNSNFSLYNTFDDIDNNSDYRMNCPTAGPNSLGRYISMVLYTAVCVIGLFGNSLVIYVVLRFSKMKTVTNLYILNLAFADEFFLIGLPILIYTMHLNEWIFGVYFCKLYMISTSITQFTSSIFLVIMSADRFIAVCHPISSPRFRTPLVSKIVSLIAWCISVFLMLPIILYSTTLQKYDGKMSCNIVWSSQNPSGNMTADDEGFIQYDGSIFTLYTFTLGFAIPLSLILIFYYLVLRKLRTVGPKTKSKEKKRSHRKVTKLVLTVIAVYVLCWTPYWVSQMALINSPPESCQSKLEITMFILVGCLGYSNSAMNPILYAFLSDNFKKSFMKAFTCAKTKEINAQLQVENSFFPRFGRSRNSECLTTKPTKPTNSNNISKLTQSTRFGTTVESILDATYNINENVNENGHKNGHPQISDGTFLNSANAAETESFIDEENEQELENQNNDNLICIINSNSGDRPPVLHTDL